MFRKPKRKAKQGLRRKDSDDEADHNNAAATKRTAADDEPDNETSELLSEARKRVKLTGASTSKAAAAATSKQQSSSSSLLHSYESSSKQGDDSKATNADLATSTAEHHPEELIRGGKAEKTENSQEQVGKGADGIFRNKQRNKFHAGPIKAAQNVRVTSRFDYEPNICKDYKETGFCGFGDTCIYLHDRGDTMTGWQLEQQWEEQQRKKKEKQEKDMQEFVDTMTDGKKASSSDGGAMSTSDGLPFACHLCREHFKCPVVTNCNHYFCESCIMNHVRTVNSDCPICSQDTGSVFNQPTKLIAKKKKVLGISKSKAENSWEEFAKAFASKNAAD